MLSYLCEYNATLCQWEKNHTFVESAIFADEVKYWGGGFQSKMHFVNYPYYPDGKPEDLKLKYYQWNLTESTCALLQWLDPQDDGDLYKESYVYTYLTDKYPENVAESYALRLLIHYIGDMHQPFHVETLYSDEFPTGDQGGNSIKLKNHYASDNLHSVFDHLMYTEHISIERPITDEFWPIFVNNTNAILANSSQLVVDPAAYENVNVLDWAQESYEIAITKYEGVILNEVLP